jgi:hypothetical protein
MTKKNESVKGTGCLFAIAVLAELVFVGISINLEMIMSNPAYGLPGCALKALVLLLVQTPSSQCLLTAACWI